MNDFCKFEKNYGPVLLSVAYAPLLVYALYAFFNEPLTYHASPFSIAAFLVIFYSIRIVFFPDWCWNMDEMVGAQVRGGVPYDQSAVLDNDFPGPHPGVWLQSPPPPTHAPPGQSEQSAPPTFREPDSPAYAPDPRSFYGELCNAGGKRVVPFTSNRGYGHYVSQPL
jgi:hypothetical protein